MAKTILLHGKHAVGIHRFTIVDDDIYVELNRWRWKAKPNGGGNHVYAIRNKKINGVNRTIRMHREVIGYDGPLDIDHINRNALDNRRENLRIVTRSVNVLNTVTERRSLVCVQCKNIFEVMQKLSERDRLYCSDRCEHKATFIPVEKTSRKCGQCSDLFLTHQSRALFCSYSCKMKARWARRRAAGKQPPSVMNNVEYKRQWRERRRNAGMRVT